jgi:hypothetical protein
MRRLLLAAVILAFPLSAMTVSWAGSASAASGSASTASRPASAAAVPATRSSAYCKKIKGHLGPVPTTIKLKACKDKRDTGGSGSIPASALTSGSGTITWANSTTTTITGSVTTFHPGACPAGDTEYVWTGSVTASTSPSIAVGSVFSASICESPSGSLELLPGTDLDV